MSLWICLSNPFFCFVLFSSEETWIFSLFHCYFPIGARTEFRKERKNTSFFMPSVLLWIWFGRMGKNAKMSWVGQIHSTITSFFFYMTWIHMSHTWMTWGKEEDYNVPLRTEKGHTSLLKRKTWKRRDWSERMTFGSSVSSFIFGLLSVYFLPLLFFLPWSSFCLLDAEPSSLSLVHSRFIFLSLGGGSILRQTHIQKTFVMMEESLDCRKRKE